MCIMFLIYGIYFFFFVFLEWYLCINIFVLYDYVNVYICIFYEVLFFDYKGFGKVFSVGIKIYIILFVVYKKVIIYNILCLFIFMLSMDI